MALTFTKQERLSSRTDISSLLEGCRTVCSSPLKAHYKPNGLEISRIMVSVPKKNFKRAVKRNLLKRRIRESWRLLKDTIPPQNNIDILVVYTSKEINDYRTISQRLGWILEKICACRKEDSGVPADSAR